MTDSGKTVKWGPDPGNPRKVPSPEPLLWREFWSELEQCGHADWPQLIRLPARIVQAGASYAIPQVIEMLREATEMLTTRRDNEQLLVTLEPNADGNYQITAAPDDDNPTAPDEDRTDEIADNRLSVFLDARALLHET